MSALAVLVGCAPDPLGRSPAEVRAEKANCDATGGRWAQGGITLAEMCFRETEDAGKPCRREGDCSGFCMADTRTCSTVTPMFGCHEYLDEAGRKVGICID